MKFNSIKFPYPVLNIQQYPMSPRTQDQIFIILFWPQRSGKNLWKAARIFCKTAIKGCRNLQTLHSIPSYFPRSRYLPLSFLALSSFASVLFDRTRVFFEKRYHDIPAVSILHLPTSLVFSPFFFFFFKVLPSLFLPIDARRPLLDICPPLSPLFCPLFFLPLSSTLAPTLYSFFFFHFLVFPLLSMSTIRKISTNLQYFVSDHFYSLTHIPASPTGVLLGRQIYRQVYWGCTRVKCHRSKFLVCRRAKVSREYRIRDEDQPSWFIFRVGVIRRPP